MHRFFLSIEQLINREVDLPVELSRQVTRVLRLKVGSEIILLDDQGFEYLARLDVVNDQCCKAVVQQKRPAEGEPVTKLTLLLALTQREKFEWILQKCTEIGVSTIIPITTSRTLIQKPQDVSDKYPRWKKIILEAAEQSHRGRIPELLPAVTYQNAVLGQPSEDELRLILWEDETNMDIKSSLRNFKGKKVFLLIGPEGGLSKEEVEIAQRSGFKPVSLGKRILRMETAAMLSAGLVLHELG